MLHQEDLIVLTPCSRFQHVLGHLCCLSVDPVLSCVGFFLACYTTIADSRQAVFDQLVTKGRALHTELLHSVRTKGHRYIQLPEIAPFYTTRLDAPQMPTLNTNIEG